MLRLFFLLDGSAFGRDHPGGNAKILSVAGAKSGKGRLRNCKKRKIFCMGAKTAKYFALFCGGRRKGKNGFAENAFAG